ncbi:MAG: pilin [Francisellaceae bacterium]|jgi:type IV pilus assembly protein PilA|nr:pilin [Francisellaceae bacterium]MBT6208354.1 pilin [Francisellaceae bacterium]
MWKYQHKAFSLIELLITIAIIGILAGIALPSYSDYINKAEVTSGLTPLVRIKTKVVEYYNEAGSFPSNLESIGLTGDEIDSEGILERYEMRNDGVVSFIFEESGKSSFNLNIDYIPEDKGGMITWQCTSTGHIQYAPHNCRSSASGGE